MKTKAHLDRNINTQNYQSNPKAKFSFDYLNPSPLLYISGKKRPSNIIGTIIGIISFLSMTTISLFFISDFFSKREINVLSFTDKFTYTTTGLRLDNRIFQFRLSKTTEDVDPRLGGLKAILYSYNISNVWITEIPIEKCKPSNSSNQLNEDISNAALINNSDFYCFANRDNISIILENDQINTISSYLIVYAGECVNSTFNSNHCYPIEIIKEYLKVNQLYVTFLISTMHIDHFHKESPLIDSTYLGTFRITHGFKYLYQLYYRQIKYTTDNGFFFENCIDEIDYYFDTTSIHSLVLTEDNKFEIEGAVYQFQFSLDSSSINRYKRFYPKVQNLLANISASLKVITLIGRYLIEFFCSSKIFVDLFEKVYYDDHKDNNNHKNNKSLSHDQSIVNLQNNNNILAGLNNSLMLNNNNNSSFLQEDLSKINKTKTNNFINRIPINNKHNNTNNACYKKDKIECGRLGPYITVKNYCFAKIFPNKKNVSKYILNCESEIQKLMSIEYILLHMLYTSNYCKINRENNINFKSFKNLSFDKCIGKN